MPEPLHVFGTTPPWSHNICTLRIQFREGSLVDVLYIDQDEEARERYEFYLRPDASIDWVELHVQHVEVNFGPMLKVQRHVKETEDATYKPS